MINIASLIERLKLLSAHHVCDMKTLNSKFINSNYLIISMNNYFPLVSLKHLNQFPGIA